MTGAEMDAWMVTDTDSPVKGTETDRLFGQDQIVLRLKNYYSKKTTTKKCLQSQIETNRDRNLGVQVKIRASRKTKVLYADRSCDGVCVYDFLDTAA